MTDSETLTLRTTVIGGIRYADDYAVVWRGLSIGRIMKAIGAASDKQQWAWNCYIHGRASSADDSGSGHDLADAKAKFRAAWARIRAGLTELDIARAALRRGQPRSTRPVRSEAMIASESNIGARIAIGC
jgi:hypothetical protein